MDLPSKDSPHFCHRCKSPVSDSRPGRKDECPRCKSDLHVCQNCVHHDRSAYNECREPNAERVVEKDRANFCDYFAFRTGTPNTPDAKGADPRKALDDLFK